MKLRTGVGADAHYVLSACCVLPRPLFAFCHAFKDGRDMGETTDGEIEVVNKVGLRVHCRKLLPPLASVDCIVGSVLLSNCSFATVCSGAGNTFGVPGHRRMVASCCAEVAATFAKWACCRAVGNSLFVLLAPRLQLGNVAQLKPSSSSRVPGVHFGGPPHPLFHASKGQCS